MIGLRAALVARREAARSDTGAYAILFALLVVVLVGVAALVLDLALVRETRAANRSSADSAVVAASKSLRSLTGAWTPHAACLAAWSYLAPHIPGSADTPTGASSCDTASPSAFTDGVTVCPTTGSAATWSQGSWRVVITWPVPRYLADGTTQNPLLSQPDTRPASPTQTFNSTADGSDAGCDRIAVQVFQQSKLSLGGIFGIGSTTTSASSVARNAQTNQSVRVAGLNVLETTNCNALQSDGQSTITVGTTTNPGYISVDSDGKGTCTGNGHVVAPSSATGTGIFVRGTGGILSSYAMSSNGTPANAYDTARVPNNLNPAPVAQSARVTRSPVDVFYNCTSGCQTGGGDYIHLNVRNTLLGITASNAASNGFTVFPSSSCNVNSATTVAGAKVFVDCTALNVKNRLTFSAATTVVFKGDVNVSTTGSCIVINVPGSTTCPSTIASVDAATVTSDALVVLQSGNLSVSGPGTFVARNTMTYLANGYTSFGGDGILYLTSPEGLGCNGDVACKYGKFWKLTLWSEFTTSSSQTFKYTGGAALKLRGVMFTPNGATNLVGHSSTDQNRAQFWTRTLSVTGGGTVAMDVDPDAAITIPDYVSTLVR